MFCATSLTSLHKPSVPEICVPSASPADGDSDGTGHSSVRLRYNVHETSDSADQKHEYGDGPEAEAAPAKYY